MSTRFKSSVDCGPLGLVLKISRMAGMAPYTYAPEFQVSSTLATCGKVFIIINGLLTISSLIENFRLKIEQQAAVIATDIVVVIYMTTLAATNILGVFTAPARMTRMADYLLKLSQFNKIVNKKTGNLKNYSVYKILVLFGGFIVFNIIDFIERFKLYPFLNYNHKIMNALFAFNMQLLPWLLLQIIFFAKTVNWYLTAINDHIQQLLSDGNIGGKFSAGNISARDGSGKKKNILRKIRKLAMLYQLICEIVLKTNEADGAVVLVFLAFMSSFLGIKIFLGIVVCTSDVPLKYTLHRIIFSLLFSTYGVAFIIFFVEQFHQTHCEMDRTYHLIKSRKSIEEDVEVEHELELFHRMLFLNKVRYSPLDLFTINRELVMKLFSAMVTYLVITLQYGPETRSLSHPNSTSATWN